MKRHALFVGINNYAHGIQPLSCAKKDADELRLLFDRAGFKTDIMTNEEASGGEAIRRRVKKLTSGLGPNDLFLFYFSGHGVNASGRQLLLGAEASYADCENWRSSGGRGTPVGTVALDDIAYDTDESFERVFILDMCRTALRDGQKGIATGPAVRDLSLCTPGVGRKANFAYLFSCDENQPALEIREAGRGLFSLAFSSVFENRLSNRRRLLLDDVFMGAMENEMCNVAKQYNMDSCGQRPQRDPHGDTIVLFDPAMLSSIPGAPTLVVCPVCGKKNRPEDTFKCRECGRDDLCLDHRDGTTFLCNDCERTRKAKEAAARKAKDEAEPKTREGADRKTRKGSTKPLAVYSPGMVRTFDLDGISFDMRWVPASTSGDRLGFWMGEMPVTQALWNAVMGFVPHFDGPDFPVRGVSWSNCRTFLDKLNQRVAAGPSGSSDRLLFRLPTEEEWRFACLAGASGPFCRLSNGTEIAEDTLHRVAWFKKNAGGRIHPVGTKEANAFGLRDMLGNVSEWTQTTVFGDGLQLGGNIECLSFKCAARQAEISVLDSFVLRRTCGLRLCASRSDNAETFRSLFAHVDSMLGLGSELSKWTKTASLRQIGDATEDARFWDDRTIVVCKLLNEDTKWIVDRTDDIGNCSIRSNDGSVVVRLGRFLESVRAIEKANPQKAVVPFLVPMCGSMDEEDEARDYFLDNGITLAPYDDSGWLSPSVLSELRGLFGSSEDTAQELSDDEIPIDEEGKTGEEEEDSVPWPPLGWDQEDADEENSVRLVKVPRASADSGIGHADSPQPHKAGDVLPMAVNGVSFNLRWIPLATVTRVGFWLGETPVTQELWTAVMARKPRDAFLWGRDYYEREGLPVSGVSWNDCQAFLKKLNSLSDVADSGLSFRLPEETEWEFACRAGGKGTCCLLSDGREITKKTLDIVAWFGGNSGGKTHPVRQREPNAWGLYDMHGNVCEWMQATDDEIGILCGGSWWDRPRDCVSSSRDRDSLDRADSRYGFRICADQKDQGWWERWWQRRR